MKDNLDIFIGTDKTFEPKVTNRCYKIIVGNHEIENNSELELIKCGNKDDILDDKFFSEIYMLKKLVEMNYPFKEYVGFCHYRKYFEFMDDVPDIDEVFENYEIVVSKPITLKKTIKDQYKTVHNIEDLYIVGGIICDKYVDYSRYWNYLINHNILIPYEMFIMKKDDFINYINFIWDVLQEYLKIVGTDITKHIMRNSEKYMKSFSPNNTLEYQYRIGGYLAERLTNAFIIKNFKKIKTVPVKITETKYKKPTSESKVDETTN